MKDDRSSGVYDALFRPRSIAIVGGSESLSKPGGKVLANIVEHHYQGTLWVVNPGSGTVKGVPAFPSIADLPGVPELGIIAIPANEIVIPTVLMLTVLMTGISTAGAGTGVMFETDLESTKAILVAGGWTLLTGVNLMIFSLIHNPCSTTLYTMYKETGSRKWTALAALLPLVMGFSITFIIAQVWRLIENIV